MPIISNLNESGLSRLWKHNELHDCGALTAFRTATDCGKGNKYSKSDNKARNKLLLAKLMSKGYSVTKLSGQYPEGGITKKESSFFVVDIKDSGNLEKELVKLGKEFEQDSVLFIPKGSIQNKTHAYLIGTNRCPNNWLGYGKKNAFHGGAKLGYNSPIYTSKVNGRPFIFESVEEEILPPGNGMGWWQLYIVAAKKWSQLKDKFI